MLIFNKSIFLDEEKQMAHTSSLQNHSLHPNSMENNNMGIKPINRGTKKYEKDVNYYR